jgi:hypothetical protein
MQTRPCVYTLLFLCVSATKLSHSYLFISVFVMAKKKGREVHMPRCARVFLKRKVSIGVNVI